MSKKEIYGSYSSKDVVFLLKIIEDNFEERSIYEKEKEIQNGVHYSEMLPIEYEPSDEYIKLFKEVLHETKQKVCESIAVLSKAIIDKRGENIVLVSLARAGTPIGVLIKRFIEYKYGIDLPHYSISIIRDIGFDENAIKYILKKHPNANIQFIDGWTGKGTIKATLEKSCEDFNRNYNCNLDNRLAVLADPGRFCEIYASTEDFLIPNACLNSTVSGLVSRTLVNQRFIGENDFHGAKLYNEFKSKDLSNYYIDIISEYFPEITSIDEPNCEEIDKIGLKDILLIQKKFLIDDINFIKPGVGETTRVLLRRIPWKILINDFNNPNLKHILKLAKEKNIPVELFHSTSYSCFGLIKKVK